MEFLEKIILPEIFNFPNTIEQLTTKSSDNQHILHTVFFFFHKNAWEKHLSKQKKLFAQDMAQLSMERYFATLA